MTNQKNTMTRSVLIMGATGRTGLACLHQMSKIQDKPMIHAFCRDPSKLEQQDKDMFDSIIVGDARKEQDVEYALTESQADLVIVSVGNGDSVKKSDIRTASAKVLARVITQHQEFKKVRVLVISSSGAGTSDINIGFGFGKLVEWHLRHILRDHTGQESAFKSIASRTLTVRPTGLTENEPIGKLVEIGDKEKLGPSMIKTDRADLADWIIENMNQPFDGRAVNLTGAKM